MNYTEYVGQHSMEFLQKLLTEIITSPKVDIRFEYADDEQWSVTPMWVNDEDQEVARGRVAPVEVLEDQHERAIRC